MSIQKFCKTTMLFKISLLIFLVLISNVVSDDVTTQVINETTTTESTSTSVVTTTTGAPKNTSCPAFDGNCEECVKYKCYYCETDKKCNLYEFKGLIPSTDCSLSEIRYTTCAMSLKLILILIGILAGVVFLIILCVCCWCCCCRRKGIKFSKDDLKFARQREERRVRAEEKKKERAERTEEIRRKYGLVKEDNPYQRFEA